MPYNNYMSEETQKLFASSFHVSLIGEFQSFQEKISKAKEFKAAPQDPFDQLVYLVEAKLQGIHEFQNKPRELKEDRTYIKLLLVNLVQSEMNKLIIQYKNGADLDWLNDKTKRMNFIRDYNCIIKKALKAYDIIDKHFPLKTTTITSFLQTIQQDDESRVIIYYRIPQLIKHINEYNQDRKSMHTSVELDLKEIQVTEREKKEYINSLPSDPVTLDEVKIFISREFKSYGNLKEGDAARCFLANALILELNKFKQIFDTREVKSNKEALIKYYEDVTSVFGKANLILAEINKKFGQDPSMHFDHAMQRCFSQCNANKQALNTYADFKVVMIKKRKGWLDGLLKNPRFAEQIKYAEESELEAKTRPAVQITKGIVMVGAFFGGLALGATSSFGSFGAASGEALAKGGDQYLRQKKRESWEAPLSRITGEKTTGVAFAVREDIDAKDMVGQVIIDEKGKSKITYFSGANPSQDEEKAFEFLYAIEAQPIDSLRTQGTNHQIGKNNVKGQVMICRNPADAFGICDIHSDGATYDQKLGWRKYQPWTEEQRQSISHLDIDMTFERKASFSI